MNVGLELRLRALGASLEVPASPDVTEVIVPGALEIGAALNALADADEHDALVAIGCVIRGETYHFELVAHESAAAVTRVGIDHGIAIANAILTCDTPAQAHARAEAATSAADRSSVVLRSSNRYVCRWSATKAEARGPPCPS